MTGAAMTNPGPKRVVLAAGGTGGHLFPAQALARELIARGIETVLVTDQRGAGLGPEFPQVQTHRISAGGIAGGSLAKKAKSAARLALGYLQARRLLGRLAADAVVGFGGYASVPTTLAGARLGLRVVLHEQNAVLGRANRLLAPRAHAIATGFSQVQSIAAAERAKVVMTGNPVRPTIAECGRRPYGAPGPSDPLRLLVFGGSQGAQAFNDLIPTALCGLPEDLRRRLSVSQQVPGGAVAAVEAAHGRCGLSATLAAFFDDMPERLADSHLVICRAGASTVAELAAAGRPAILVPFPAATDDHQTANARAFAEAGGGWLMPQAELTPERLSERLAALFGEPATLARAASCAGGFARRDAAARLADLVCGLRGRNGDGGSRDDTEPEEAAA
jgi:UDP-N-acetylglucosamine--N-acetylmuramyl-(pentapeptide) pyrophosphoryl-undecaprenol N-acetylglucosamine transferase